MPPRTPSEANPVDIHVGKMVRARRKALGLSQTDLADALGITFQQIQKYERGSNRISASKLYETARTLKVEISVFFDGLKPVESEDQPFANIAHFLELDGAAELANAYAKLSPAKRRILGQLAQSMVS
jgi:transcriptional regulator with XRE-family HTH domain